ncbi:MAG: PTS lactose/cellobiose transporter subunit IIA [Metamycoplasmataceae bacterium]
MAFTLEKLTEISFQIITFVGMAKSDAMEGIYAAKAGNFELAKQKIDSAHQNMVTAEKQHFDLIQKEAAGQEIKVPLILMHAEDQLLSTQTLILLAEEMIDIHKKMQEGKK